MKIIENVLNKSNLKLLQQIISSSNFPWYYLNDSAGGDSNIQTNINSETYSFFHSVLKDGKVNSNYFDVVNSCCLQIKDKFKLDNYHFYRLRFGLTTSSNKKTINNPHIDLNRKHKTILFYLNNSDGETCFYNNKNNIIDSITPEENKAILFDGNQRHSSSKPIKNSIRIVLNINLIKNANI